MQQPLSAANRIGFRISRQGTNLTAFRHQAIRTTHGRKSRLTRLDVQHSLESVCIPSGCFSFGFDTSPLRVASHEVEGEAAHMAMFFCAIAGSVAADAVDILLVSVKRVFAQPFRLPIVLKESLLSKVAIFRAILIPFENQGICYLSEING